PGPHRGPRPLPVDGAAGGSVAVHPPLYCLVAPPAQVGPGPSAGETFATSAKPSSGLFRFPIQALVLRERNSFVALVLVWWRPGGCPVRGANDVTAQVSG